MGRSEAGVPSGARRRWIIDIDATILGVMSAAPERSAIVTKMKELLELGRRSGYRREDLLEMLQTLPG